MKSTYTNFKHINDFEKAEMLKILDEEQGEEEQSGNILILKDKEETRIFTIVKEEIIRNEK